tara:strand:- start:58 stop:516 length:459 start_codon:yes stop_codon:yes gene_type:complete
MSVDIKEYNKQYYEKLIKTPEGKKKRTIRNWKKRGLIGDYEEIYDRYINTTNCHLCKIELCDGNKGSNKKCMEHNHITGEFRNIVCHSCNINKSDIKKQKNNTTGYKNIYYNKSNDYWSYKKSFKGVKVQKYSKNKIDILCIKFAGLLLYKY